MADDVLDDSPDVGGPAPSHGFNAGKKLGPFTAPVWAVIIVGGGLAGFAIRKFQGNSSTPVNTTAVPQTDANNPANYGYTPTGGPFAGGGTGSDVSSVTTGGKIAAASNVQWAQIALDLLIAQGTNPAVAQQAIGNYLDGLPLTAQQKSIVSLALRLAGSPPDGAPPIQDVPDAPAPPVDGGSGQSNVSTPVPNPAQPVTAPPAPAPLAPIQQQWVGDVLTTIGLLNVGGQTAIDNFPKAQFLQITTDDPHLNGLVAYSYAVWLQQHGDPNHLIR